MTTINFYSKCNDKDITQKIEVSGACGFPTKKTDPCVTQLIESWKIGVYIHKGDETSRLIINMAEVLYVEYEDTTRRATVTGSDSTQEDRDNLPSIYARTIVRIKFANSDKEAIIRSTEHREKELTSYVDTFFESETHKSNTLFFTDKYERTLITPWVNVESLSVSVKKPSAKLQ